MTIRSTSISLVNRSLPYSLYRHASDETKCQWARGAKLPKITRSSENPVHLAARRAKNRCCSTKPEDSWRSGGVQSSVSISSHVFVSVSACLSVSAPNSRAFCFGSSMAAKRHCATHRRNKPSLAPAFDIEEACLLIAQINYEHAGQDQSIKKPMLTALLNRRFRHGKGSSRNRRRLDQFDRGKINAISFDVPCSQLPAH
jgi:hypothetical protein